MIVPLLQSTNPVLTPQEDPSANSDLTEEEIESLADQLLETCVKFGAQSGIYTNTRLNRKIRDERKRLESLHEDDLYEPTIELAFDRQIDELIDAADLNEIEKIIWRLWIAGFTGKRISEMLGIKRRVVKQRLRIAKRHIRAAYLQGPYAGWYEVYLSEVNRVSRWPNRHNP